MTPDPIVAEVVERIATCERCGCLFGKNNFPLTTQTGIVHASYTDCIECLKRDLAARAEDEKRKAERERLIKKLCDYVVEHSGCEICVPLARDILAASQSGKGGGRWTRE